MKKLNILFIFFLCHTNVKAQFDFANDTSFHSFGESRFKRIDSIYSIQKKNDFELRVWSDYVKMTGWSLFILMYKNNNWSARFFEGKRINNFTLQEIKISNDQLNELWQHLKNETILTIKDSQDLEDSTGKEASVQFTDGASYRFELIAPNRKRHFYYYCPKNHSEEYPYIKEFKQVENMIAHIYQYCQLTKYYICKVNK